MRRYGPSALSAKTNTFLVGKQALVDLEPDRAAQYKTATALFAQKANAAFDEVRTKLIEAGPLDGACYYCERDRYRDIDHVRPKRHYPEYAFAWSNYVYACAVCNQDQKRDTYAIISGTSLTIFDRRLPFTSPIPLGTEALIDVRAEDPFDFLKLDLVTGYFVEIGDAVSRLRGSFTRDLFNLNEAPLSRIRRLHVVSYRSYLQEYVEAKDANNTIAMDRVLKEIKQASHRTVFLEMVRQKDQHAWLAPLIDALPLDARQA